MEEYFGINEIIFYIVIFLANIIQGITGFAGTILAMSPSIMLVGYHTAKPILNVLGILAGLIIMIRGYKHVEWSEIKKIVPIMIVGIVIGIPLKPVFASNMRVLYIIFGVFILWLAFKGLFLKNRTLLDRGGKATDILLLITAGLIHGLFVSGGPLLIEYVSRKVMNQQKFRTTLSAVWVVLNTIILVDDIRYGYWNGGMVVKLICSVPLFLAGIGIGSVLCKKMSRGLFMFLTYILMAFSGVMLLLK